MSLLEDEYINSYVPTQAPEEDWSDHMLTAHFMCGLMSDLEICKFRKKYGHTWHRMSLLKPRVINPPPPPPLSPQTKPEMSVYINIC